MNLAAKLVPLPRKGQWPHVRDMPHGSSLIGGEEELGGLELGYSGLGIREAYTLSPDGGAGV